MANRQKLELTWIGKEHRPRLEPRILLEDPALSYHAEARITHGDLFDNRLIFGDNLLALKALEQEFTGRIGCVFIDPPYNTGAAFTHYDDGVEHSLWLSLMRDRLVIIRQLLSEKGTLWAMADDNEAHYLKLVCDEVFGRANFIGTIIWEKSDSPRMDAQFLSSRHDYILVYAKSVSCVTFNRLPQTEDDVPAHYDKQDEDGRRYYLKPLRAMGGQGDSRAARPNLYYALIAPDGTEVYPRRQDGSDGAWRWSREKVDREQSRIDWVRGRGEWTPYFRIYADAQTGRPGETIWFHSNVGSNRTSKAEVKALVPELTPFGTPKPERLLQRVLQLSTQPGDWVLDSFAGSGTTGAVAHKMGRSWIMVELGEHCHTYIVPRLRKVVEGTDQGGVSRSEGWKGGGGFRYFRLAPSLLQRDGWGNLVVNKDYNPEMLAEAMCKHMGFTYAPSDTVYWQHGHSTENDYIYVTTQTLTHEQLVRLNEEVGEERTLLICCRAFRGNPDAFPNLTVKKIPNAVLHRCEWGRDDYSLNVANLPSAPREEEDGITAEGVTGNGKGRRASRRTVAAAPSLPLEVEADA